jgi:translation elongation factor EF-Ts
MPAITADMVMALSACTECPMVECKAALVACGGDMQRAIDWLRAPSHIRERRRQEALEARVDRLEELVTQQAALLAKVPALIAEMAGAPRKREAE